MKLVSEAGAGSSKIGRPVTCLKAQEKFHAYPRVRTTLLPKIGREALGKGGMRQEMVCPGTKGSGD